MRADLLALSAAAPDVDQPGVASAVPLALPTASHLVGALYTVEGSTLGGQVLLPMLATKLGVCATRGASSFVPYGPQTMAKWRHFRAFLDRWPGPDEAVIDGANACFACYRTWVLAPRPSLQDLR